MSRRSNGSASALAQHSANADDQSTSRRLSQHYTTESINRVLTRASAKNSISVSTENVQGEPDSEEGALEEDGEEEDSSKKAAIAPSDRVQRDQAGRATLDGNFNTTTSLNETVEDIPLDVQHTSKTRSSRMEYSAIVDLSNETPEEVARGEGGNPGDQQSGLHEHEDHFNIDYTDVDTQSVPGGLSDIFESPSYSTPFFDSADFSRQETHASPTFLDIDHANTPTPPPTVSTKPHFDSRTMPVVPHIPDGPSRLDFSNHNYIDEDEDVSPIHMSGYETGGETTDEEAIPSSATKAPRDFLRQPSLTEGVLSNSRIRKRHRTSRSRPSRPYGPVLGTWRVNPNKVLAQTNEQNDFVLIYPDNPAKIPPEATSSSITARICPPCPRMVPLDTQMARTPVKSNIQIPAPRNSLDAMVASSLNDDYHNLPSDFLPLDDNLEDIHFAEPTSDQESDDLEMDLEDILNFTDDSADCDDDSECIKLLESGKVSSKSHRKYLESGRGLALSRPQKRSSRKRKMSDALAPAARPSTRLRL